MVKTKDPKGLQIRHAEDSDIRNLVCLENECFRTYYKEHRFSEAEFIDYLYKKQTILLAAILNSSVIGYVAGSVKTSRSQLLARLDSIAVFPKFRRKGVGKQLMQSFVEEAKQQTCKRIILEIAAINENGILFFSRLGFRRIRRLPEYYGEGLDGVLMRLDI